MRLGIDASNIRVGGGVTHLVEFLRAANPSVCGFTEVIVWSSSSTLNRLESRPWLVKVHQPPLDKNLPYRAYWQSVALPGLARRSKCDVVFAPGGSSVASIKPL